MCWKILKIKEAFFIITSTSFNSSWQSAQNLITNFLASNDVNDRLLTAYGDGLNLDLGLDLLQSIATGETTLPIAIVDRSEINNANGAYSSSNNTIYLASELVASGDVDAITRTLLEEIGHKELHHYLEKRIFLGKETLQKLPYSLTQKIRTFAYS